MTAPPVVQGWIWTWEITFRYRLPRSLIGCQVVGCPEPAIAGRVDPRIRLCAKHGQTSVRDTGPSRPVFGHLPNGPPQEARWTVRAPTAADAITLFGVTKKASMLGPEWKSGLPADMVDVAEAYIEDCGIVAMAIVEPAAPGAP